MKNEAEFNEIVEEIKRLNLVDSIILFGSASKSNQHDDIDLMLYSEKPWTPKKLLKLIEFMSSTERSNPKVSFSFSSGETRQKERPLKISLVPSSPFEVDEILEYSIKLHGKTVFGKNPYAGLERPPAEFFLPILLRQKKSKADPYSIIKQYVFIGLLWKHIYEKKENQLERFDKEYNTKIFGGHSAIPKFIMQNRENLGEIYEELEKVIMETITKEDVSGSKKDIRKNSTFEEFYFKIIRELRMMYAKKDIEEIRKFLLERQTIFEKEFAHEFK